MADMRGDSAERAVAPLRGTGDGAVVIAPGRRAPGGVGLGAMAAIVRQERSEKDEGPNANVHAGWPAATDGSKASREAPARRDCHADHAAGTRSRAEDYNTRSRATNIHAHCS
jgi:hypothetical protein